MTKQQFVHLDVHTEYSVEDSVVRIPGLIKAVVADQMPAIAITDVNNLFGAVKFYMTAMKQGVKPIIGATIRVQHDDGVVGE